MSEEEAILEPVRRDEITHVVEINRSSLPENYPTSYFVELYSKYPLGFLIAKIDGKIIGYIMCRIDKGFQRFQWIKKAHVVSIAIAPDYQGRRIGEKLLTKSLANMSHYYGASKYILEVRESNPAVKFYKRLGFETQKVLKSYYTDGEDGLFMERKHWENVTPRSE
ncbi:MAG: GNAT family N-acetyltransferase [Candidatus Ranarchaeia archaeon]|jgi:ribosomal-protein-alanine N-acetyltransferase